MNAGNEGKGTTAKCPICGKKFRRKHTRQIFCDRRCSAIGREKKRELEREQKLKKFGKSEKEKASEPLCCCICGGQIVGKNASAKYCSMECKRAGEKQLTEARKAKQPTSKCEQCGQDYFRTYKTQRFCSRGCAAKHNKEGKRKTGPANQLRQKEVLIMVVKEIPVKLEMRPKVGKCYLAKECWGQTGRVMIIPEIGRLGLIVREDEAKIVQGV